jgi:hypothetical protein
MADKQLKIGAVLTITTGIVMVERFDGVGEAFEWIMGHPVWTHEMPSFFEAGKERVLRQYPDFPTDAGDDWRAVLAAAKVKYGDTIAIEEGEATREADPITTLVKSRAGLEASNG